MKTLRIPSLILLVCGFVNVQSAIILESKCGMHLVLERNDSTVSTMERVAEIEREAEAYFSELLTVEQETNAQLTTILKVCIGVQKDIWTPGNTMTLDTTVNLVYRSETGRPLMLDEVLADIMTRYKIPVELKFGDYPVVDFDFRGVEDDTTIIFMEANEDSSKSGSEKGLIVATSFLSVMLIIVSSVLLYITGGWDAFSQAVTNCLFEEVDDDDNYLARSKPTLQVQSSEGGASYSDDDDGGDEEGDDDNTYDDLEDASLEDTSTMTMTPKGMLGAMPVTQGLGIKTPHTNGTYNNGDFTPEESAITDMTDQPMGITSMRKMPQTETPGVGGLSRLMMKRLNNSNKKE